MAGGDHQVLLDGELGEDARLLEGARQALAVEAAGVRLVEAVAVEADGAGIGLEIAGDDVEGGGLARPVRPDKRRDRALGDREAAIVDGAHAAEMLAQPVDFEERGRHLATCNVLMVPASAAAPLPERVWWARWRRRRSVMVGRMPRGRSSMMIRKIAA